MEQAELRLCDTEGHGFERLIGLIHEERSRKGVGDFPLTEHVRGYWDTKDTEIDLVAICEPERRIRLGTCKRDAVRLIDGVTAFDGHVQSFLDAFPRFRDWRIEKMAFAPKIGQDIRQELDRQGLKHQDIDDLLAGLVT